MLIAEDLLLLLTDDETGKRAVDSTRLSYALAGAVLIELTEAGRLDVAGAGERVKQGRLIVRDPSPTGDPILDRGLALLQAREGRKARDVVGKLAKGLPDAVYARLAERGMVRQEHGTVLGLFPRTTWPASEGIYERQLRSGLEAVLFSDQAADERTGPLISLLSAIDQAAIVVDTTAAGLSKRQIGRRAKEVASQSWGSDAVKHAVDAVNAAVMASIVAATLVATSSG